MGKRPSPYSDVKVLGSTESRGIPALVLQRFDLESLPNATAEQQLWHLIEEAEKLAELFGNQYFPDHDWRTIAPYLILKHQTNLDYRSLPTAQERKRYVRYAYSGLSPEFEELLVRIGHTLRHAQMARKAIAEKDLFEAALWSHLLGNSAVQLLMHPYQRIVTDGRGRQQARVNGARATNDAKADERLARAHRIRDLFQSLQEREGDRLSRKALLTRAGRAQGVSYKTAQRDLEFLANLDKR